MEQASHTLTSQAAIRVFGRIWWGLVSPLAAVELPEQRREMRLLSSLLLALMALTLGSTTFQLLTVPGFLPTAIILGGTFLLLSTLYWVSRTRYYRVAVGVLSCTPTVISVSNAVNNPSDTISLAFLVIGVLLCSIFCTTRALITLSIANLSAMLLLPVIWPDRIALGQISGLISFVAITSCLIILATRHRAMMERDRQQRLVAALDAVTRSSERLAVESAQRKKLEGDLLRAQRLESVGLLAGGIAHDFNNLLTIIRSYTQLVIDGEGIPEAPRNDLREVIRASERAANLTRQLLAFARRQVLEPHPCSLNALISETKPLLHRLLSARIELTVQYGQELWPIFVDPVQIEQVLLNLTVNARDAMPAGGTLTIATRNVLLSAAEAEQHGGVAAGDYVLMRVADTGVGMSADVQKRIFEPFFTTKGPGQVTGLGLPSSYGIIGQHGGHIWLDSEPDRGTTFYVYLPRGEAPVAPLPSAQASDPIRGGSETLLVVEDEDAVRAVMVRLLESLGYRVIAASNGVEALRLVDDQLAESLDLVVADLVMPQLGGQGLVRRLREQYGHVRALYVTGYADAMFQPAGPSDSSAPLMRKPYTPLELARKIRELLDS